MGAKKIFFRDHLSNSYIGIRENNYEVLKKIVGVRSFNLLPVKMTGWKTAQV